MNLITLSSRIGMGIVVVVSRRLLLLLLGRYRPAGGLLLLLEKRVSQIGVRRVVSRDVMRRSESGGSGRGSRCSRRRRRRHLQLVAGVVNGRQFQVRVQITDRTAPNQRVLISQLKLDLIIILIQLKITYLVAVVWQGIG